MEKCQWNNEITQRSGTTQVDPRSEYMSDMELIFWNDNTMDKQCKHTCMLMLLSTTFIVLWSYFALTYENGTVVLAIQPIRLYTGYITILNF